MDSRLLRRAGIAMLLCLYFATLLYSGEVSGQTPSIEVRVPEESIDNIKPLLAKMQARLAALEGDSGRPYPTARLKLLQMQSLSKPRLFGESEASRLRRIVRIARDLEEEFKLIAEGKDPLAGRTGLIEGAYISPVDGSVQPYRLYIPSCYGGKADPGAEKIPLIIRYHGYNPSYDRTSWIDIGRWMARDLEETRVAMLMPFGRSNTDFLGVGELDVRDAIEAVAEYYHIDRNRLYLFGYSMGGSGVWTTLVHYPDIFAAAYIRSGRTDYYYCHERKREDLPAYLRLLIDTDNPIDLMENLRKVPLKLHHPTGDTVVKPGHTSGMVSRLNKLGRAHNHGIPAPLEVTMPVGGSHWDMSTNEEYQNIYQWMLKYELESNPKEIELTTFTPKYGKRAWLQIEMLKDWGKRAYIKAKFDSESNKVLIETIDNISVLAIEPFKLPMEGIGMVENPSLQMPEGFSITQVEDTGKLVLYQVISGEGMPQPLPILRKTPKLCGPVKEAFNAPFMLVKGTIGSEEEKADLASKCERFKKEWLLFAKGEARVKDDTALTEEDIEAYNLVCFGTPTTNAFLAMVCQEIPYRFIPGGYGVGEAEVHSNNEDELGFLACYPNPKANSRLLVIADGLYYGDFLGINHKWDLVPDYIIFNNEKGLEGTNSAVLAGFFDSAWQFDKSLLYKSATK
ncbi:MAG: prolyl oligopeptidase family serine peptidase [Planctomycetes bacterium]|nr:prolyl oligopeptidase family serine peptidase [Planctomycetota bacterium]